MIRSLAVFLLAVCGFIQASALSPKYEMRGAWIATVYGIDWPSERGVSAAVARRQKSELSVLIDRLHRAGFNAVFFQVRPMADALYRSSLEPWSYHLTGSRGSAAVYDPLEFCVAECHSRGMECHAWVNPLRVGPKAPATAFDRANRHLWMSNTVGSASMTIFNPAIPQARRHIVDVCLEIARNYDIDGIIFDDYFYNPEFIPEDDRAADWQHYQERSQQSLEPADWRRANINALIREVGQALRDVKNGTVRFGVSPQGIAGGNGAHADASVPSPSDFGVVTADSQFDKIYSDPVRWLRDGLVDYISPQIYWPTTNPSHPYGALAQWWSTVASMFSRQCFPSITLNNSSADEQLAQLEINRNNQAENACGTIFYSASHIVGPRSGDLQNILRDSIFSLPALVPSISRQHPENRLTLTNLSLSDAGLLSWDRLPSARYIVYAIPSDIDPLDALSPQGGISQQYILGVTYVNNFQIPAEHRDKKIAVAPYDRYGVEWEAQFLTN